MKILVIGGIGIIGGAISKAAVQNKYEVYVVSRRKLPAEWASLGVKGISGNWMDDYFAKEVVQSNYDVIIDTQVFGEKQLIRSMKIAEGHCTQYMYISTDSVYAHPAKNLRDDDFIDFNNIYWEYGKDKRIAELYLLNNGDEYSFSWTCIRPTLTFGNTRIPVGYTSKRNTYTIAERIINERPIIRFDDSKTKHSICHTSIFGEAVIGLFLNEKAYGQFFHISDDYAYSYNEIFAAIEKVLGVKGIYVNVPTESVKEYSKSIFYEMVYDKNPEFILDNTKIKTTVPNVNYHVDIEAVMKDTLSYLKNNSTGEDKEYNYISDNILIKQADKITDDELRNQVNKYLSNLPDEYLVELNKFRRRRRIDNLLYPLKKCTKKIKHILIKMRNVVK